jgi:hypothetical protein
LSIEFNAFELFKAAKIEIEEKKGVANRLRLFHCTHQPRRAEIANTPPTAAYLIDCAGQNSKCFAT